MKHDRGKKPALYLSWILRGAATVIVLVGGGIYLVRHQENFSVLAELRSTELAALSLSIGVFSLATGYAFYLLAQALAVKLSPVEWLGLTFLGNALNYLSPVHPGTVVKAAYLKRKGMAYSRFSSLLAAHSLIGLLCTGITGLVILALIWLERGITLPWLMVLCFALIAVPTVSWLVPVSHFRWRGRVWDLLNHALKGFDEIRSRQGMTIAVATTIIVQYIIGAFCFMIAFQALDFEVDFLTALVIGVFVPIFNLVAITPGNIGIQEMTVAYLYSVAGMNFTDGLVGAGLVRAVHVVLTFLCAPLLTYWMLNVARLGWSSLTTALPDEEDDSMADIAGTAHERHPKPHHFHQDVG